MHWSVVGHEKQKRYVERLLKTGGLAHAYLFAGPEGIGKRMMAEDIAAALVPAGHQLDVMRLAPTRDEETGKIKEIAIEEVQDLKLWISLRPTGKHKVVIIDDADRLGGAAANTLLKVLEEPPAYAYFLLVSAQPEALMGTVASRCERVDYYPLSAADMKQALSGARLDADDRALLAAVVQGRPGAALRLVQDGKLPGVAKAIAELATVLKSGVAERIAYAKKLADREDASDVVSWWLAWTHAQLSERPQLAPVAHSLLDLSSVLSQSQFNRRLAVERFFLETPSLR